MLSAGHEGAAGETALAINEIRTLPRAGMMVCCTPPASRDGRPSAAGGGAAEARPAGGVAAGWGTVPPQELDSNLESGTGTDNWELGEEFCGFTRLHPVCLVVIPVPPRLLPQVDAEGGWVWAGRNGDIARGSAGIIVTNTLVMVCLTAPLFRLILSALTPNWRRDSPLNEIPPPAALICRWC